MSGGKDSSVGRLEISYDDQVGSVCAISWNQKNAQVLCKSLGFVDGLPQFEQDPDLRSMRPLMSFFLCDGNEKNLLNCLNSGFDGGRNVYSCNGDAYAACFHDKISKHFFI